MNRALLLLYHNDKKNEGYTQLKLFCLFLGNCNDCTKYAYSTGNPYVNIELKHPYYGYAHVKKICPSLLL